MSSRPYRPTNSPISCCGFPFAASSAPTSPFRTRSAHWRCRSRTSAPARAGRLVNTTSLGMKGQPALELDAGLLPSQAVVADLVYVPLQTPLLAAAQGRGLRTADGLGMLLHQAVRGFELWFGRRPEVTSELRAIVEADLNKV